MAIFTFELFMPGVNSWNDRWTGEDSFYARTRRVSENDASNLGGLYHYDFGDGWRAAVTVKRVDVREAAKIRKRSAGFHGYDWMIDSILKRRVITA